MTTGDMYHRMCGVSFAGVPVAQTWTDFILWEAMLNGNPETQAIVELGTWSGGFSLYLAAQARARGLKFRTYDATPPDRSVPGFVRQNVLIDPGPVARYIRAHEPVALLVDNGNKPRELKIYAPVIRDPRSLVVVHDWLTEVQPADVPGTLVEVYGDYCDEIGSMSRAFRIKEG